MSLTRVPCPDCGQPRGVEDRGTMRLAWAPGHVCAKRGAAKPQPTEGGDRPTGVEVSPAAPPARKWSGASPTTCGEGHRHASKMEARVCARLAGLAEGANARLLHQVRFPLLAIAPKPSGKPHTITIDFVLIDARGIAAWRAIDAKSPTRISRDWRLRTAAFEATYGVHVEECDR